MSVDGTFTLGFEVRGRRYASAAVGLQALARNLNRSLKGVDVEIKREMRVFLQSVAQDLAAFHGSDWSPGGEPSARLKRRSGRAIRSIVSSVKVRGSSISSIRGEIGGIGYLRIHEYGGTVTAKNSRYLTIPLPPALRANGTPIKKRARDWPNTFVITSKKGNKLICTKRGGALVPLYLLKKSVRIPARLGMRRRLLRDQKTFADRAMAAATTRMMANV